MRCVSVLPCVVYICLVQQNWNIELYENSEHKRWICDSETNFLKNIAHNITLETLIFFQTSLFKFDIGNNHKGLFFC